MRISHRELEACFRNPRQWFISKTQSDEHGFSFGYHQALKLAIHQFHRTTSPDAARQYLSNQIARHDFKDMDRVDEIQVSLDLYIDWMQHTRTKVAGSKVRLSLDLGGFLVLGGEVSRVDVVADGYRAVNLERPSPNWREELRMPLIQLATARIYGRPIDEVEVGFQSLDASSLETVRYKKKRVSDAEVGLKRLGMKLQQLNSRKSKHRP